MGEWHNKGKMVFKATGLRAAKPEVCPPAETPSVSAWARASLGLDFDPIQAEILDSPARRIVICATRQMGKSFLASIRILHQVLHAPGSLVIIASPGERQSGELFLKVRGLIAQLGLRTTGDGVNALALVFPNSSRLVALPENPDCIRGFSGSALLVIDEAAFATDELYTAVLPFLARSEGTLWMISTPRGQSGLFYDVWHNPELSHWRRFRITAEDCPRIPRAFLDEMKLVNPAKYWQEYMCEFIAAPTQIFDRELIDASRDETYPPFFGDGR